MSICYQLFPLLFCWYAPSVRTQGVCIILAFGTAILNSIEYKIKPAVGLYQGLLLIQRQEVLDALLVE